MTAKHQDPVWRKTRRIVIAQVRQAWVRGESVRCWRHGDELPDGAPFDVGHVTLWGGNGIDNAAPECRHGNRSHGGKLGARITNQRRQARTTGLVVPPWA